MSKQKDGHIVKESQLINVRGRSLAGLNGKCIANIVVTDEGEVNRIRLYYGEYSKEEIEIIIRHLQECLAYNSLEIAPRCEDIKIFQWANGWFSAKSRDGVWKYYTHEYEPNEEGWIRRDIDKDWHVWKTWSDENEARAFFSMPPAPIPDLSTIEYIQMDEGTWRVIAEQGKWFYFVFNSRNGVSGWQLESERSNAQLNKSWPTKEAAMQEVAKTPEE